MKMKKALACLVLFFALTFNLYAANVVDLSLMYVPNSTRSGSLSNARIYVGNPDTDPEVVGNQKQLQVQQESGTIVNVTQPIYTNAGGIPIYNNSPVTILVEGQYSLKINNSYGSQIYYIPKTPFESSETFYIDPSETNQSVSGDGRTLYDFLTSIGTTKKASVIFRQTGSTTNTDYVFSTNYDVSSYSNVSFIFENGARLSISPGVTLTLPSPDNLSANKYQNIFTGSGTILFSKAGEASIRWWNGNFNGTTNDQATIQAGITSLVAGSTLLFPYSSTRYYTTDYVTCKTGVSMIGENETPWYMPEQAINTPIMYLNSTSDLTISGFKLYSDGKDTHIYGVSNVGTNNNVTIKNCYLYGLKVGLTLGSGTSHSVIDCRFEDIGWTTGGDGAGAAIILAGTSDIVDRCYFKNIGMNQLFHCIYPTTGSYGVNISNCYAEDIDGFMVASGTNDVVNVVNCTVKDCYAGFSGRLNGSNLTVIDKNNTHTSTGGSAFLLFNGSVLNGFSVTGCEGGSFLYVDNDTSISNGVCQTTATYWNSAGISIINSGENLVIENVVFKGTGVVSTTFNSTDFCLINKAGWTIKNCTFDDVVNGASNAVIAGAFTESTISGNMFLSSNGSYFNMINIEVTGNNGNNFIKNNIFRYTTGTPTIEVYFNGVTSSAGTIHFEGNASESSGITDGVNFPILASSVNLVNNSNTFTAHINFNANIESMNGTVTKTGRIVTLYFSVISTIKHNTGTTDYKFITKSGSDIITAAEDIYQFMFVGTYWVQI